ncbi:7-cyano-7-deazaguanine synthase QueC [Tatlockia micdadei]|uniref:7-cyano-7-deazaguanine synthase QueC n=1 Tax=Legionella micdadei TaxID=451 RepID=UPI00156F7EDF|nr:7-cyano-7-deazaguanine synthase QueC [Legionella micdadei]NSL19398.1 7-cyano-7-deazaguanine synthase QueC [Legionella micdadei]
MKKAVVLLSGGLDSTTCLAIAQEKGFACYALSFAYGQRHSAELAAAYRVAKHFSVAEHRIIDLDIGQLGGSALTDKSIQVPDYSGSPEIPVTYVPARNTVFLSYALGFAEVIGARDIFIGVSSVDYSHYPDCRPEYIAAFQTLANLATKAGVEGDSFSLHAPLQHLSKAETILVGSKLGVDYALTVSCYQATESGKACGRCDSCRFRKQGFEAAQLPDPTFYA